MERIVPATLAVVARAGLLLPGGACGLLLGCVARGWESVGIARDGARGPCHRDKRQREDGYNDTGGRGLRAGCGPFDGAGDPEGSEWPTSRRVISYNGLVGEVCRTDNRVATWNRDAGGRESSEGSRVQSRIH